MSKNIFWVIALFFLVSCQDKTVSEPAVEVSQAVIGQSEVKVSEPAVKEIIKPDEHAVADIVAKEAVVDKAAADKVKDKMLATEMSESTSKSSVSETQIEVQVNKGVEVSQAEQPEVKVVSKSDAPKQEAHVKDIVEKMSAAKVVAPLTQGKGPIKSEPNPAPSDIMLKSEQPMSLVKANSLTKKCKACHATDKDKVGPSYKKIQTSYGSAGTLAAVFESGFAVENRKVAMSDAKWKKKAKTMTGQYKKLIKKQVNKGKFTYKELAEAIFAK